MLISHFTEADNFIKYKNQVSVSVNHFYEFIIVHYLSITLISSSVFNSSLIFLTFLFSETSLEFYLDKIKVTWNFIILTY